MAALVQSKLQVCQIDVLEAETSTHLDSASTTHHGAAASKLARSLGASWRLRCKANCRGAWSECH